MDDKSRYVACLLDRYHRLPGTVGHLLRHDRRTACALYDRRIGLDVIERAFLLATARRTLHPSPDPLEPIRTLGYFLPVIEEVLEQPPDPSYLLYLASKLRDAGLRTTA